jgi:hypothetical protein
MAMPLRFLLINVPFKGGDDEKNWCCIGRMRHCGAVGPRLGMDHVHGSISSIDPNARQITLDNGTAYTLERSVNLADLAVGDKVTVSTEMRRGEHIVNKVSKTG